MKLSNVVELATIKSETESLFTALATRTNEAVLKARDAACAQFIDHFNEAGFSISEEPNKITAARDRLEFVLAIDDAAVMGPFCTFSLTPPTAVREPKLTVQMFARSSHATVQVTTGSTSVLQDAEKELRDARQALASPAPDFDFIVVEQALAGSFLGQSNRAARPRFSSFKEFLNNYYPQ